jgi:hypothetical protein
MRFTIDCACVHKKVTHEQFKIKNLILTNKSQMKVFLHNFCLLKASKVGEPICLFKLQVELSFNLSKILIKGRLLVQYIYDVHRR